MKSQEVSHLRTWIEIDARALHHNVETFLRLIPETTRFMAVIKSNAYGHGLVQVAKLLATLPPTTYNLQPIWFGVDSITEALRLRREGIKNPLFVLGYTLPSRLEEAADKNIVLTVSSFDALKEITPLTQRPIFHIKVDTGMHRQGFLPDQTSQLVKLLKLNKLIPGGIYTHFASARDPKDREFTVKQVNTFQEIISCFQDAGFSHLITHAAASGGTLLFPESHFDMVRVGMGMYGYWPSEESKIPFHPPLPKGERGGFLKPVLTWKTIISEVKEIPRGSFVGYDGTERVERNTKLAVLPIGYWHGYDRGLSSIGEVLAQGKRAKVLGRISMDMIAVDVTDIPSVKIGEEVTLIGKNKKETLWADELAGCIGTTQYEFLTRINPLIKRVIV